MRETWYVLEDGSAVNPNEVAPNDNGRLVHASGALVAMRGDVPSSRGVDVANTSSAQGAPTGQKKTENESQDEASLKKIDTKDLQADRPKRAYKRRDVTAD